MKKLLKKVLAFFFAGAVAIGGALPVSAAWEKNAAGQWSYRQEGVLLTGWQKINGSWYYFNSYGKMQTGWVKVNGVWYYCAASGAMRTGWQKVGKSWYYLSSSGAMKTGWVLDGDRWYYLKKDGVMTTGWLTLGEKTYFLDSNGRMLTGGVYIGDDFYVFNADGTLNTETPDPSAWSARVLEVVNAARKEAGASSLAPSDTLQAITAIRAKECVVNFDHTRPDGSAWSTAFDDYPNVSGAIGENIAMNYFTPEAVVEGWMNSPGHRANILNPKYGYMGVSYYEKDGYLYWAQLFAQKVR